ncbi:hypothetical protein CYMTET_17039 [Cymbomonas tetramitiformis]|uniref:Uncharacterized protein n=1 Tax=Cymbomonas tetramitiformis TaxID=36881 RepID=A0AAE0GAZ8_9CHLO|nr:hypothetical protein CYMTET_17039 [Cymbomonas tetramitiformis]
MSSQVLTWTRTCPISEVTFWKSRLHNELIELTVEHGDDGIGAEGAEALAEALKSADCKLHMLNLTGNGIGGDGAKALAEAVKSADCKLDTLDLS